jgi:hypothetical protein
MTSRTERGTCTFDDWARAVEEETEGRGHARDSFGAHLWFVEILGRRWSYLAGEVRDQPAGSWLMREKLDHNIGIVIESWGAMGREDRGRFRALLNRLIAARAAEKEGPPWTASAAKAI